MVDQKCILRVESYEADKMNKCVHWIQEESKKYNVSLENPVSLPMKKKVLTVLRSPHIDKKSREQFEIRTYRQVLIMPKQNKNGIQEFLNSLKQHSSLGVSLRVKLTTYE
uniref:Ribosomal protein S10 n=1 Tax=Andalucia godoyi TaxID=505711 RepID=M4QKI0_ANDGO|nr:ribosomal protein S10 [Andalucia godoyi]AGH23978.1 ribosomal protein S10 [Andalucia godoyi]